VELVNILIDTNIALYFLSGDKKLSTLLDNTFPHLSFLTELELLAYPGLVKQEEKEIKAFIDECITVDINDPIKERTLDIRQQANLKLPDAIIAATAISEQLPFFLRR